MSQRNTTIVSLDEPICGEEGILFKEFIAKSVFKSSLRYLFLELTCMPSIAQCIATFSGHSGKHADHSSEKNELLEDTLIKHAELLIEEQDSDSETLEDAFASFSLPCLSFEIDVVPLLTLPELESFSGDEDSTTIDASFHEDNYTCAHTVYLSASRV